MLILTLVSPDAGNKVFAEGMEAGVPTQYGDTGGESDAGTSCGKGTGAVFYAADLY